VTADYEKQFEEIKENLVKQLYSPVKMGRICNKN